MMASMNSATLLVCFLLFALVFVRSRRQRPAPYPPGPLRLPILGNALSYPRTRAWETFSEWSQKYGDVVYLSMFGRSIVVLQSMKAAKDLLDKRSAVYSDRPRIEMASLAGFGHGIALSNYGEEWRLKRKLIAPHFASGTRYSFVQEAEARKLVGKLLNDPINLQSHCKLSIANIISRVTYGFYLDSDNDPFYTRPLHAMEIFVDIATPGNWAVNFLPFLKHLPKWAPGAGFLSTAAEYGKFNRDITWDVFAKFKKDFAAGKSLLPNVCADLVNVNDTISEEEEWRIARATASVLGGGLDTNMATILTFFLLMIHNPKVQAKAHEEILRVVGKDRLPSISDRPSLPYLRSVIAEVMRFHPAVVLGIAHTTNEDDIYNGMFIPKGSIITPNMWLMLHEPELYPDPHAFKPERYNSDAERTKITDVVFGFGRRVCPGSAFAEVTVFSIVSTVLATCEVIPTCDTAGREIIPELLFTSQGISPPEPYQCSLRCRSEEAYKLLQKNTPIRE